MRAGGGVAEAAPMGNVFARKGGVAKAAPSHFTQYPGTVATACPTSARRGAGGGPGAWTGSEGLLPPGRRGARSQGRGRHGHGVVCREGEDVELATRIKSLRDERAVQPARAKAWRSEGWPAPPVGRMAWSSWWCSEVLSAVPPHAGPSVAPAVVWSAVHTRHTHTRARAHTHTRTRTHAHTHTQ